jgi:hypothetical protein
MDEPEWFTLLDAERQEQLRVEHYYSGLGSRPVWRGCSPDTELLMQIIRDVRRIANA